MRLILPVLLAVALGLSGCLPSSQRSTDRALFPADSLSRLVAEATPTDTLTLVWRAEAPREANLRHPLTLAWVGDRIVVADAQRGVLHTFSEDGEHLGTVEDRAFRFPFLSGSRGDTLAVVSRGSRRLHLVRLDVAGGGEVVRDFPLPEGNNIFAHLSEHGLFAKTADEGQGSTLYRLDETDGSVEATHALPGPYWRHIGFLRAWGDTLVSLSGYRPVVDVLTPQAARPDTLALVGFDSPQMERSRAFAVGDSREPPLLIPSADPAGALFFVLNARPGWIHMDAFERAEDGLHLRRSLLSPQAGLDRNFFAADVAVRERQGSYEIVVLQNQPRPALLRYRWTPPPAPVAAR